MRINFTRNFLKKLDKCPEKVRERFEFRLNIFLVNTFAPELNNHTLHGAFSGHRSININGD